MHFRFLFIFSFILFPLLGFVSITVPAETPGRYTIDAQIDLRQTVVESTKCYEPVESDKAAAFSDFVFDVYENTCLEDEGVSEANLKLAITGFFNLLASEKIARNTPLTLVDYNQTSIKPRLFVIDLANQFIEHQSLVAHGRASGGKIPHNFSNKHNSHKTSLGFYRTSNTYIGQHGYSLRLDGLESGINDGARSRAIVMHGASYVSNAVCREYGYLGRSWGCPSLPLSQSKTIISSIKNGSCLFLIANDEKYLSNSDLIDEFCASEFFWNNRDQLEQYI